MKITLHGAAGGEVTGSAYLVQTKSDNQRNILAKLISSKHGIKAEIPKLRQTIEIE